jgi:4-hydroxy-2-oxoheptanedioate aldolase
MPKTNIFLKIPSPWIAEVVGQIGFDYVTIDMQHGLIDYATLLSMLQTLRASASAALVRVPWNDPSMLMRVLDAGAAGIVCPMINTATDAGAFVRACRYPPQGIRSYGPIRAKAVGLCSSLQQANTDILTFAMIETGEALTNLEQIAATPGLSGLYVGPSDLSISLGIEPMADFSNAALRASLSRVVQVAAGHRLVAATQVYGIEQARLADALGFGLITPFDDNNLFEKALTQQFQSLSSLFIA